MSVLARAYVSAHRLVDLHCCVRVTNLQRCVFIIPRAGMLDTPEVAAAHAGWRNAVCPAARTEFI